MGFLWAEQVWLWYVRGQLACFVDRPRGGNSPANTPSYAAAGGGVHYKMHDAKHDPALQLPGLAGPG